MGKQHQFFLSENAEFCSRGNIGDILPVSATITLETISNSPVDAEPVEAMASIALATAAPTSLATEEAAHTLTMLAQTQSAMEAATQQIALLQKQLAEGQTRLTLERANAEQARRVAECLRAFHQMLLDCIAQPCFTLDSEGIVVGWNPAMEHWSQLAHSEMVGQSLADRLDAATRTRLDQALRTAFSRRKSRSNKPCSGALTVPGPLPFLQGSTLQQITLLPLYRIPGTVEAVIALLQP